LRVRQRRLRRAGVVGAGFISRSFRRTSWHGSADRID
jgi:hypothetical protein